MHRHHIPVFAMLFLASLAVHALEVHDTEDGSAPWLPAQGMYWNPDEHGIYYHVSVGPGGYMLVAITHYTQTGEPSFSVMQGEYQPTSEAAWRTNGEIGQLRSPLYRMQGGQCLTCPPKAAKTIDRGLGIAEMSFADDGSASFRSSLGDSALQRYPLYTTPQSASSQRYAGDWLAVETGLEPPVLSQFRVQQEQSRMFEVDVIGHAFASRDPSVNWFDEFGEYRLRPLHPWGAEIVRGWTLRGLPLQRTTHVFHDRDHRLEGRPTTAAGGLRHINLFPLDAQQLGSVADAQALLPAQGLYWRPGNSGNLMHVSVGSDGFLFAALTTFNESGEPTFLVLQGQFQPGGSREVDTGYVQSPFYRMQNGQCLGCDYRDAEVIDAGLGTVRLSFDALDGFVMRWGDQQWAFKHYPLYTNLEHSPQQRYQGRWVLSRSRGSEHEFALLQLEPPEPAPPPIIGPGGQPIPRDWLVAYPVSCLQCSPVIARLLADVELQVLEPGGLRLTGTTFSSQHSVVDRDGILYANRVQPADPLFADEAEEQLRFFRLPD